MTPTKSAKSKLRPKVGRWYMTRSGRVEKIIRFYGGSGSYPFEGISGNSYAADGRFVYSEEGPRDLIREVRIVRVPAKPIARR